MVVRETTKDQDPAKEIGPIAISHKDSGEEAQREGDTPSSLKNKDAAKRELAQTQRRIDRLAKKTRTRLRDLSETIEEALIRIEHFSTSSLSIPKHYPDIGSANELAYIHKSSDGVETRTLDIGCGANIRNPFEAHEIFGLDIREDLPANIKRANLALDSIPFESSCFDYCTAFDVIEHIPRILPTIEGTRSPFIELMNEIHRILKPGGLFLHSTPAYPAKEAFQDPTHVNIITEDTMKMYFCEPLIGARQLGYGFKGCFELVEQRWVQGVWIAGLMRAIK